MPRRALIALLTITVLAPLARAQSPGLPAEQVGRVEAAVKREMAAKAIPGLSVAVVTDRSLRWSSGFGVADLENAVPAKAGTVYRLASVSKPITATAAMQLAEAGKLDLDAPVQKYLPTFPEKRWPVTTRRLLGHQAGIRHYRGGEVGSTRRYTDLIEPLKIFQDDPLEHEPGTKYLYSSYGYNLAGVVVEKASGQRFVDYLKECIFRPAGMDRIRDDDAWAIIPNRAQGYRRSAAGEIQNSVLADTSNKIPGGGLCGTVEDLAKFAVALQNDQLLKPATREQMWTRGRLKDGTETSYGLGWSVGGRPGRRVVGHSGAQPRVATYLYLLPDQGAAVALMCNLEGTRLEPLAREIGEIVAP